MTVRDSHRQQRTIKKQHIHLFVVGCFFFFFFLEAITVKSQPNGVLLTCGGTQVFKPGDDRNLKLEYKDENSGEYQCVDSEDENKLSKIYVKFRSKFTAEGGFCANW